MLTVNDVAERLNVSSKTIRLLILNGELMAYRVGGQYRVPAEAVDKYLADRKVSLSA